jgi:uncharacterized protein (TIGR03067 family)
MRLAILCSAILAIFVAPLGAQDKDKKEEKKGFDAEKLVGTWTFVSGTKNGEKASDMGLKSEMKVTKDKITLGEGDMKFEFKYTLDAKKNPVAIDLEITASPFGAGMKALGIISVEGDELKLCYAQETRPEKFDGAKAFLFVMKKKK